MSYYDWELKGKKAGTLGEIKIIQEEINGMYSEIERLSSEINRLYAFIDDIDQSSKHGRALVKEQRQLIQGLKDERSSLFENIKSEKDRKKDLQEYLDSLRS